MSSPAWRLMRGSSDRRPTRFSPCSRCCASAAAALCRVTPNSTATSSTADTTLVVMVGCGCLSCRVAATTAARMNVCHILGVGVSFLTKSSRQVPAAGEWVTCLYRWLARAGRWMQSGCAYRMTWVYTATTHICTAFDGDHPGSRAGLMRTDQVHCVHMCAGQVAVARD